ncbi:nucleotide exchange factor GrpE [Neopusillimonas maritima]|jgi:molecular chaperone GrpE|uniref:Protein GrpE n=1 Tax=Neopusillimonas maritima TaxID=2026239 RepID=A0A3A1YUN5_9BURK|nr:nucleotide exchange factor GrpE [Neopusillimonas maritima]MBF23500.1 nucleotide exchange factor GrpE [Pusillimonas sp.]RIY41922.1 nucleotide exchange factor GrpE [Neopusillimonas maritima]|tara:strand:+ start:349 stop:951 length:603 start_codon:yes stop_codon:yes gene_type:complete
MSKQNEPLDPKDDKQVAKASESADEVLSEGEGAADVEPAVELESAEALAAKLEEAQAQVGQYYEELLRAKAETENIRRRAQDDVAKARKFGIESFAESLVPVKDSLEAALGLKDQSPEAWQSGVEATLKQLVGAFERNQLKEVAPAEGDKFDPNLHQAISSVPSDLPEGAVVQMLQKGYTISDRVLRPALVAVSSGKPAQ